MSRHHLIIALVLLGLWSVPASPVAGQTFLGKDAAAWLRELDQGKEGRMRRSAAFALGKLGNQAFAAVGSLKKHLREDQDASVREAAAFALGEIGKGSLPVINDPELVAVLEQSLGKDPEVLVRRSAALALGNFGSDAKPAQGALEAAALGDTSPAVRQNAAWALGRLGPTTVPSLRKALQDKDLLVRRDAAGSLGLLDPKASRAALPELLACCQEKNSSLRLASLTVLNKIVEPEDSEHAAAILPALVDPDLEVKQNAALTLANIGGSKAAPALPILLEALGKGEPELRRDAALAIGNIGPDAAAAIQPLIQALSSTDRELRRNAALALGGIKEKAEAAIPALVKLLANPREDKEARVESAVALSKLGVCPAALAAAPALLKVLEDPKNDTMVRERVIWALRVHNRDLANIPGVFPAFSKILSEAKVQETRMLRYDCAYMLGVLQGPEAPDKTLDVLLDFLKDETILVFKGKAVQAGGAGKEANTGKGSVKEEGKDDGRVMAIQALKRIGTERVVRRSDIVEQLRHIAANPKTLSDLKEKTMELLESLGK